MAGGHRSITALIPTHSHGRLLRHSASTVLAQTIEVGELLIVGDGADEETRDVARELERSDERVRFIDNPKGPGHGLAHRHAALERARGEVVCYLSDDDLWLPEHAETMLGLLEEADFAHAIQAQVRVDGTLAATGAVNLEVDYFRNQMLAGERNLLKFSMVAHTLEAYRRLPGGWLNHRAHLTFDGYFETWREFLSTPGIAVRSGTAPTVLRFLSIRREHMTLAQRDEELGRWRRTIATPAGRSLVYSQVLEQQVREATDLRARLEHLRARRGRVRRALDAASARVYSLAGRDA